MGDRQSQGKKTEACEPSSLAHITAKIKREREREKEGERGGGEREKQGLRLPSNQHMFSMAHILE